MRPGNCHAAFERLRAHALAGMAPGQERWGLALLTGRGLAAWAGAWAQAEPGRNDRLHAVMPSPSMVATAPSVPPVPSTSDSHLVPAELVTALASMILGALRREVADGDRTPES